MSFRPSGPPRERGNIFFYILLGIVLFAALIYAVSRNRMSSSGVSDTKAKLLASQIIEQGNMMAEAAAKIRLKGYKDTQISFYDATYYSTYTNANCIEAGCRIFDPAGGGINVSFLPSDAQTGPLSKWLFAGDYYIYGVGVTGQKSDLVAYASRLTKDVCTQVNALLGVSGIHVRTGNPSPTAFTGGYNDSSPIYMVNGIPPAYYKTAACIQIATPGGILNGSPANSYFYYQVLQGR